MIGGRLSPEKQAKMIELLPAVDSLREIALRLGIDRRFAREEAQPLIAILKLQGALPACPCGRERFHPGGCRMRTEKTRARGQVPGQTQLQFMVTQASREAVIAELMTGDSYADMRERIGATKHTIRAAMLQMTPAQMMRRRVLEAVRAAEVKGAHTYGAAIRAAVDTISMEEDA
jgi:hypothetical protein